MSSSISAKILNAIKAGDTGKYLQVLYDKEYPKVRRYIVSNSGTDEDAKDIFQESLMTLISHVKLNKYKEEYEVGGFLFSVSRNAWRKKASRSRETEEINENSAMSVTPYSDLFNEERKKIISDLLDRLGENCKGILVATLFYDKSLKEVAEEQNYTNSGAVKTRNYKCKKRLGALISEDSELENYLKTSLYE